MLQTSDTVDEQSEHQSEGSIDMTHSFEGSRVSDGNSKLLPGRVASVLDMSNPELSETRNSLLGPVTIRIHAQGL